MDGDPLDEEYPTDDPEGSGKPVDDPEESAREPGEPDGDPDPDGDERRAEETVGTVETDTSMFEQEGGPENGTGGASNGHRRENTTTTGRERRERAPDSTPRREQRPEEGSATGPYLETMPSDFLGELLVLEWMEFLVAAGGPRGATRALQKYEELGWIAPPVRTTLDKYVVGLEPRDGRAGGGPTVDGRAGNRLTVDDHAESLSYIGRLADGDGGTTSVAKLAAFDGGGGNGLQR